MTRQKYVAVGRHEVFYREAGALDAPAVLLLHGFPTSSHMFRNLMPRLAGDFRLIAPDLPGFGFTRSPADFAHTFESLAEVVARFRDAVGLGRHAIYVFDYGAPVGFRLALQRPDRIAAIVSQNGNAYEDGLSTGWQPIQAYWREPSPANREALRSLLTLDTTRWQYAHGVADESVLQPEAWTLDHALLSRPGNEDIQLDLFRDYASNVALYPEFQAYLARHRPPLLAVWGRNDPFFVPAGAEAYRRDVPDADVQLLETGHFALETHVEEIAARMRAFLAKALG